MKVRSRSVKKSSIEIVDILVSKIIDSEENPNEMDDSTLDELVEGIKEDGFDEPCLVINQFDDNGKPTGMFIMASGHHRSKAGQILGMKRIPCIIKKDWNDDARKVALVRRNILRGDINPEKFTKLYNELSKKHDKELLKKMMGFTKKDAFEKVYQEVEKALPQRQKKKLKEAKERIKSVDDLSSVLNTIFKEHGSELDYGFMVFSFGGKNHHYIVCDDRLNKMVTSLEKQCEEEGMSIGDVFKTLLKKVDLSVIKNRNKK